LAIITMAATPTANCVQRYASLTRAAAGAAPWTVSVIVSFPGARFCLRGALLSRHLGVRYATVQAITGGRDQMSQLPREATAMTIARKKMASQSEAKSREET
jgi:hypothetical protein